MKLFSVAWYADGAHHVIEYVSGQPAVVFGPMPTSIQDEFVRDREAMFRGIIAQEMERASCI